MEAPVALAPHPAPHDLPPLAGLALCDWPELAADSATSDAADHFMTGHDPADDARLVSLRVVLGRSTVASAAQPQIGQVVVSDAAADAPVELWLGDRRLALGHLRSLDGHYCIQITELCAPPPRSHSS